MTKKNADHLQDVLAYKHDDIKVTKLSQVCSHIIFQVTFGNQSFAVKKVRVCLITVDFYMQFLIIAVKNDRIPNYYDIYRHDHHRHQ